MDAATILILGAIILGLGSFGLLVVRLTNRRLNGLGWLGGAFAAGGFAALLLLTGATSPILDTLAADFCVLFSFFLLHVAVLELTGGRPLLSPFGVALLVLMTVIDVLKIGGHVSGAVRVASISLLVAVQCSYTAWVLWHATKHKVRGPGIFCSVLLFSFAGFNVVRGLGVATHMLHRLHIDQAFMIAAYALYVAVAIGIAFGLFWLTTANFSVELEDAAGTDPLTRLYNRRTFLRACEKELIASNRAGRTFAILMLDLDHFKAVNDRYGHPVGDSALLAVVECMQNSVRGIDILARWGGEEFAALLPNSSREAAFLVAERMRTNIEKIALPTPGRFSADTPYISLTASIGLAVCQPTDTIHSMLSRADRALYLAKDSGRNRVLASNS
jgi:diguanylate cyclase (GGDEF)-like protein